MPRLPEELLTERLRLHKHLLEECESQYKVLDAERARIGEWVPPVERTQSVADARRLLEACLVDWENGSSFDYTFKDVDGTFLGRGGLFRVDQSVPKAEIGYWVRESAEGKGYITEAVRGIEAAAWKAGFQRLEIRVDPRNERSWAVAQRLGFAHEGTLKDNIRINGQLCDTMVWAKLRSQRA